MRAPPQKQTGRAAIYPLKFDHFYRIPNLFRPRFHGSLGKVRSTFPFL
ncbi:hypothetical protein Z948_867 [Sulfitobacter donghicola DSW-25 = KCTC 12864 = JCM 14565]|nr:hypothetical protein Z948_867 [Sulfitobacter donghicola DSW-25 = KCTC 12864 = JCM 14565]